MIVIRSNCLGKRHMDKNKQNNTSFIRNIEEKKPKYRPNTKDISWTKENNVLNSDLNCKEQKHITKSETSRLINLCGGFYFFQ